MSSISLAYSVDADDAFMFHALRAGAIDAGGLGFTHRRDHTAALNRLAMEGAADVVAVSVGACPAIADRYQLLPHGASVGRGYGPVVVAPRPLRPADLAGLRVGIPGATTTAWLERTGLPLPLGVNVIRRALGAPLVARVSGVLRASIAWALAHREQMIALIAAEDRGDKALSDHGLIDHYLNLYANSDTAAIADDARRAVDVLFAEARAAGLLAASAPIDWAP